MAKIQLDSVTVEVVGTQVFIDMPSTYSLNITSKVIAPSPVRNIQQNFVFDKNTSSLSNQINQVEADTRQYGDK